MLNEWGLLESGALIPFLQHLIPPTSNETSASSSASLFSPPSSRWQLWGSGIGLGMMGNRGDTSVLPQPFQWTGVVAKKGTFPGLGQGLTFAMISAYAMYR